MKINPGTQSYINKKSELKNKNNLAEGRKYLTADKPAAFESRSIKDRRIEKRKEVCLHSYFGLEKGNFHKTRTALTVELCALWARKEPERIIENFKSIEKINSAAMTVLTSLLKEGARISTCKLPNVVILSNAQFSDFPERVGGILDKLINRYPDILTQVVASDGLFKKPIIIAKQHPDVMAEDELNRDSSRVWFYPRVDTATTAGTAMNTLFIDVDANEKKLLKDLSNGFSKCVEAAERELPDQSASAIRSFLRRV